jgi:hypothetical protein
MSFYEEEDGPVLYIVHRRKESGIWSYWSSASARMERSERVEF